MTCRLTRRRLRARAECDDDGSALIIALFTAVVLSGLGLGLLMLTDTESAIAANYRAGNQTMYAADAAAERALVDILTAPNWNDLLNGTTRSGFVDTTLRPTLPSNQVLDLTALTGEMQAASDTTGAFGLNTPQWRLFAYGRLSAMASANLIHSDEYAVVWIADDPADADGDPATDANGVITILAQAIGPYGSSRTVEVTVAKDNSTAGGAGTAAPGEQAEVTNGATPVTVRILSWREIQ